MDLLLVFLFSPTRKEQADPSEFKPEPCRVKLYATELWVLSSSQLPNPSLCLRKRSIWPADIGGSKPLYYELPSTIDIIRDHSARRQDRDRFSFALMT
eukprot:scaffold3529_cov271-Amphora_coffeaeformis.AAC.6